MANEVGSHSIRIGQLSRRTSVSPDLLRHYERRGLFPKPPRTANRYRMYPLWIVDRVRAIRAALSLGFGLDELAEIFRARDQGRAPCQLVRALAEKKLEGIDERIGELTQKRAFLARVLADWDERLSKRSEKHPARLLDALASMETDGAAASRPFQHPLQRRPR